MTQFIIQPPVRTVDKWGDGSYLASRGGRDHRGVDIACYPLSRVLSPTRGTVSRIGRPYSEKGIKKQYTLVEVKVDALTYLKYMYVSPLVNAGDVIKIGDPIGLVQALTPLYDGITNHFHFEVWIEGCHVNPLQWLENYD